MTISSEKKELAGIVNRLLDNLTLTATTAAGSNLIWQIGDLRTKYLSYLADGTFLTRLLACFTTTRVAGCTLASMVAVRQGLFAEVPVGSISTSIVVAAVVFCLSAESRIITLIEFTSRNDIDAMMKATKEAFDTAREMAADWNDSSTYQAISFLSGALTSFLANSARPLPRMMEFNMKTTYTALALSNRIYYTAERWEEVALENKVINPVFCPRTIIGLSS